MLEFWLAFVHAGRGQVTTASVSWCHVLSHDLLSVCQLLHSSHPFSGNCDILWAMDYGRLIKMMPSQLNTHLYSAFCPVMSFWIIIHNKNVSLIKVKQHKSMGIDIIFFRMHCGILHLMSQMIQALQRIPAAWGWTNEVGSIGYIQIKIHVEMIQGERNIPAVIYYILLSRGSFLTFEHLGQIRITWESKKVMFL